MTSTCIGPVKVKIYQPIENLWQDSVSAVHRCSPSCLTECELFCEEKWGEIFNLQIDAVGKISHKTCSCNCREKWLDKVLTGGGAECTCMPHSLLNSFGETCISIHFTVMRNFMLVYKINSWPNTLVCSCNVTKCGKAQSKRKQNKKKMLLLSLVWDSILFIYIVL